MLNHLSLNPNAIHLLEQNIDNVNWYNLSCNPNPNIINLVKQYSKRVNWHPLSMNPSIFTYDYEKIRQEKQCINEQIITYKCRPILLEQWLHNGNTIDDFYNEFIV